MEIRKPSVKETEILEALREREMFGLELVEASSGRLKRGTVYVTLGRMEEKGYVESRLEERRPGAIGLPRRLYRATAFGMRVLGAWNTFRETLALEGAR
jgi:PadR family transcriptional regulator, regulatory protein PadR